MADTPGTEALEQEGRLEAPEGVAAGAASGAVVGGVLGWLIGIGAITMPGIGPLIAAGPIVAALAGIGAAGATGGLIGALVGVGISKSRASGSRLQALGQSPCDAAGPDARIPKPRAIQRGTNE